MPISNRILQLETSSIIISRTRQRSLIEPGPLLELACSIGRSQWISPLLVDEDTNELICGERRLTAVKCLAAAVNGDYSWFPNPEAAKLELYPVQSCKIDSWKNWTRIPAQPGKNLSENDIAVFEFIENAHREDLSWQDKARAIYSIHAHGLRTDKSWNHTKTGMLVGLTYSTVASYVRTWAAYEDDPSHEIATIIKESPTLQSASQSLNRYKSRRQEDIVTIGVTSRPGPAPGTAPKAQVKIESALSIPDDEPAPPVSFAETILLNKSFHDWAKEYEGQPFNFIHCDFPYGINFNTAEQARSAATIIAGEYDDSPEVYWELLNTLATYQESLIAPSAHIMFWFSQNLRAETEAFFAERFPRAQLQSHWLIWHCSDGDGIVPDAQRYGRRTYETAMVLSFGDRKIVAPKALSFAAPRGSATRIHRSQKPLPVLEHFMSMFVDNSSRVLDPTAGSGSSLLAAHGLKAEKILGLELDPQIHEKAIRFVNQRQETVGL